MSTPADNPLVDKRQAAPSLLLLALPYAILVALSILIFKAAVDDPFITFRYAANILRGEGPVFNPGERVEGFTSPLHLVLCLLLLTILPSVGILFKAKVASLIFGCLVIWQTGLLAKRFNLNTTQSLLIQLTICVNMSFIGTATNGLETTLYASILLAAVMAFMKEMQTGKGIVSALLLFLAVTARPEAAATIVCLFLLNAYYVYRDKGSFVPIAQRAGLLFALITVGEVARYQEYGLLFPNTYYAKRAPIHPLAGIQYLLHPFTVVDIYQRTTRLERALADMFGVVYWAIAMIGAYATRRDRLAQISMAPIIATCAFIILVSGDWMTCWRFGIAMIPFLTIFQYFGLLRIAGFGTLNDPKRLNAAHCRRVPALMGGAITLIFLLGVDQSYSSTAEFIRSGGLKSTQDVDFFQGRGEAVGGWLAVSNLIDKNFSKGSLIAYSEMGYASYHNIDIRFIDIRGLTDATIARFPSSYKYSNGVFIQNWPVTDNPLRTYVLSRHPDAIVTFDCNTVQPPKTLGNYMLWKILKVVPPTAVYVKQRIPNKDIERSARRSD